MAAACQGTDAASKTGFRTGVKSHKAPSDQEEPISYPLKSTNGYNRERVQRRIQYAETLLSSKTELLTPNTEKLIILYKATCHEYDFKHHELTVAQKKQYRADIRIYEKHMKVNPLLRRLAAKSQEVSLLKLRRHAYCMRYRHYMLAIMKVLKQPVDWVQAVVATQPVDHRKILFVHNQIISEDYCAAKHGINRLGSVSRRIHDACKNLSVGLNATLEVIYKFTVTNDTYSAGLEPALKAHKFTVVAEYLYNDLRDLTSCFSSGQSDIEDVLRALLEQLISDWFEIPDSSTHQPKDWKPTSPAKKVGDAVHAHGRLGEEHIESVVGKVEARLIAARQAEDSSSQSVSSSDFASSSSSGLNAQSTPHARILENDMSERKRIWFAIFSHASNTPDDVMKMLLEHREINRMVAECQKICVEATLGYQNDQQVDTNDPALLTQKS